MLGYGVYWAIIEDLYQNANAMQTDYDCIAFDLRVQSDMVKSIINDTKLFVVQDGFFGSLSVQRRLDERDAKSKKARESASYRWNKSDTDANAMRTQCDGNAIKEKKEKEKKKKNILLSDLEKSDILTEHQKITIEFWKLFKNNILSMGGSVAQIEKSKSAKWVESIRLMMEVDKITIEQLQTAYRCLNPMDKKHSEFWVKTCHSTDNLRKNFNKIIADYGNSKQTRSTGTTNEELAAVIFKHFGDGTGQ
jgi:hypothetical protein